MPDQQPGDQPPAGPPDAAPPVPSDADEPPTDPVPARWTGAAAVPDSGGRRARKPKPLDPTLDLPIEERDGPPPPPVDPWADAAPWDDLSAGPPPALPPTLVAAPHQPPPHPVPPAHQPPALPPATPPLPVQRAAPPAGPPLAPATPRKVKRPRGERPATPPHRPPPGWGVVPPGYELRRRRRRWPRRLTMLLLMFGCCCACPAYYVTPMWQQYPASAAVPQKAANLTLRDDARAARTVRQLEAEVLARNWLADDRFAAVYDGGPGWQVTVYGTTGFRLAPKSDLDSEIARLTEEYRLTDVREVDAGALGGHQRCGFGETAAGDDDLVLCAWADHGSLGVATFSAGSLDDGAETLRALREAIVRRD